MRRLIAVAMLAACARAQLVSDAPHHDFGSQPQQQSLAGSFTVRNDGETPVFIQSVAFNCLCAKGGPKKRTLQPGETTTIDFTFKTGAFEGAVKKPVQVRYGSQPVRTLRLSIGGVVVPSWKASAGILDFGGVTAGTRVERTLDVTITDDHEVEVTAENRSRMLEVTREPLEGRRGWRFRVAVSVPSGARPGTLRAEFRLRSTDERKPNMLVYVQAFVESDLRVSPRFLAFGGLGPADEVRRTVVLESASGEPFSLTEIREHRFLLVDGKVGVAATRHELEVVAPKGLPPGSQRGSLVVVTDRKDEPVVRIGFSFRVRKP